MGIGVSIFLMAVGAILTFAVDLPRNNSGLDLNAVGVHHRAGILRWLPQ